jgi:p-hydroxybenzoate 3-monooxygenase
MSAVLHQVEGASESDVRRQLGELTSLGTWTAGSTYLAEAYTGWPSD